ncbi:DUF2637 domain-containing protein [Embleya sp. MST-111070]|uniref:DUF2637 domain-containing protein n=1 Tax=Embleya sp. MST-111070 TaxID=3398231 RepID=UPI003F73D131
MPTSTTGEAPAVDNEASTARQWTNGRKWLFGIVALGSVLIAGTGFVGSYGSVRKLAEEKGFGWFSAVFPAGIDVGIVVLLALDLALTWVGLRYPLLRCIAWLLTAATVAFNGAAAWPDHLAAAMHAVIPILFISVTEAARHAVAKSTAGELDRHMDSIRFSRWLLAPVSTCVIWRDMKLWEIRSLAIALERYQTKMLYRQDLRARYGRRWRSQATGEELRPLRRARLGLAVVDPLGLSRPSRSSQSRPLTSCPAEPPASMPAPWRVKVAASESASSTADHDGLQGSPDAGAGRAAGPSARATDREQPQSSLATSLKAAVDASDWTPDVHAQRDDKAAPPAESDRGHELNAVPEEAEDDVDGRRPRRGRKAALAELVYLEHQREGKALTRADLARMAGYAREGSGRTQYARLEVLHGPIVVGEVHPHAGPNDAGHGGDFANVWGESSFTLVPDPTKEA